MPFSNLSFSGKMMLGSLTCISAILLSAGVAGAWGQTEYEAELDKVTDFSDVIGGVVSSLTNIAITPIGIGASIKTFRHIVLNNV